MSVFNLFWEQKIHVGIVNNSIFVYVFCNASDGAMYCDFIDLIKMYTGNIQDCSTML